MDCMEKVPGFVLVKDLLEIKDRSNQNKAIFFPINCLQIGNEIKVLKAKLKRSKDRVFELSKQDEHKVQNF